MRALLMYGLLAAALIMPQSCDAQSARRGFRHWEVLAGAGVLPTFLEKEGRTIHPPLFAELRYRFNDRMSLGFFAGQSTSDRARTLRQGITQYFHNRFSLLSLRAFAHTRRWERWEVYGGLALSYAFNDITYDYTLMDTERQELAEILKPDWRNGFFLSAHLGTSFSPLPRFHLFMEGGFGLSLISVGCSYRL